MKRLLVYDNKYYKFLTNINNYSIKYLGAWCLDNWQVTETTSIQKDFWDNKESLIEDIDYIKDFTIRVLNSSYDVLKNDFKNYKSFDDFSLIYYSWTFNIIVKLYANWKLFDESDKTDLTYIFDIKYDQVIAENLLDSNMTYYYSKWNLFTISEIIKFRNINYELISYNHIQEKTKSKLINLPKLNLRITQIYIKNYLKFRFINKDWVFYYFTKQFNLLTNFQKNDSITQYIQLIYDRYKRKISKLKINESKRESLELSMIANNNFEIFISKLYYKIIPISIFEGINLLENYSISNYIGKQPTNLIFSDFLNNELLLYYSSNFNKSQLYVYQHGGGFGLNKYTITQIIENFYCNKYITWGWKNSKFDLPFISPSFRELFDIDKMIIRKNICIILYDSPPFIPVFQPTIYSIKYSNYLTTIKDILNNSRFKNQFTLRLYPRNDSGINLFNYFPESNKIDKSISLDSFYSKYELYFYTYNSTGFLELWSLNIPCILFIADQNWFVDEFGVKDFEELKNNNLLITNFDNLEIFLNESFCEINIWWNSYIIQNTVNNFLVKYANSSTKNIIDDDKLLLKSIFNLN